MNNQTRRAADRARQQIRNLCNTCGQIVDVGLFDVSLRHISLFRQQGFHRCRCNIGTFNGGDTGFQIGNSSRFGHQVVDLGLLSVNGSKIRHSRSQLCNGGNTCRQFLNKRFIRNQLADGCRVNVGILNLCHRRPQGKYLCNTRIQCPYRCTVSHQFVDLSEFDVRFVDGGHGRFQILDGRCLSDQRVDVRRIRIQIVIAGHRCRNITGNFGTHATAAALQTGHRIRQTAGAVAQLNLLILSGQHVVRGRDTLQTATNPQGRKYHRHGIAQLHRLQCLDAVILHRVTQLQERHRQIHRGLGNIILQNPRFGRFL